MRFAATLLLGLLLAPTLASPLRAQSCPAQRTALVLSGGGAKGLAHIGVLRVLDSLGVRPDLVVGTSMGAVVGALYASGYSGGEIDSIARSLPVGSLFRTYRPRVPGTLGVLQPLVVWEQGEGAFRLQGAAVRDRDVNALMSAAMLRGNLLALGDFDSLPIPFRAVATDLADRSIVSIDGGDLARAVRASFSLPLVFVPVHLDGQFLVDGGLAANVPIDVAREAGAERVIVSDATAHLRDSVDLSSPLAVADRLVDLLFEQDPDSLGPRDVLIRPPVENAASLDFAPARVGRLIDAGAEAAARALASAECLPRAPNPAPPDPSPVHLVAVDVTGTTASEARTIRRILRLTPGDTVDVALLAERIRELARSEAFEAIWLNPRPAPGGVRFEIVVRRAPRRVAGGAVVYDVDLGGRIGGGITDRRLFGLGLEGTAALFLGELRKELLLDVRRSFGFTRRFVSPAITASAATEDVLLFTEAGHELPPARIREAIGFAGAAMQPGGDWDVLLGVEGRVWEDDDDVERSAAGPVLRAAKVGRLGDRLVYAEGAWTGIYRRAMVEAGAGAAIRALRLRLRPRVRVAWGEDLPVHLTYPLGGVDGFPGLELGEERGDREVMISLTGLRRVVGPVDGLVEVAAGRSGFGNELFGPQRWLTGVRLGVAAETPLGPVRVAYGVASVGRGAVFVRLGRWF